MAEQACWRCGRTDIEWVKVTVQTEDMPKPMTRLQCKDTLACISESLAAAQKQMQAEMPPGWGNQ